MQFEMLLASIAQYELRVLNYGSVRCLAASNMRCSTSKDPTGNRFGGRGVSFGEWVSERHWYSRDELVQRVPGGRSSN